MTDPKTLKKELRLQALARRDALDPAYRIETAMRMADEAEAIGVDPGQVVSGFLPIRSELDIRPLMMAQASRGARLCVPAMIDRQTIVFRALVRGAPLVDNGFGTLAPPEDAEVLLPDIMLMPLAAFDGAGNRIGYGAGYYDRAIAALQAQGRRPRLIGMAFDCQQVEAVPAEPHDVPLHALWTDSGYRVLDRED
ncbi:5-formyltetrahydrofolate cyclo-ligase [Zhengella mangrovi]|uniref:5-formyltetrahydrofolate cyclo-ligase n=1 Tax=Zhengella mangrovi TaxID=1982044 RepID=A0A2G1QKQ2_9HYPH|nr:5-formyltetrahydrofolate cyclo-ligase [Zhengella mangrovi]PHP66106.1 5-formyltetrahydrofolate cyclo-ligase [Zhengella mangrovi]